MSDRRIIDAISQGWCTVCLNTCDECRKLAEGVVHSLMRHGYSITNPRHPAEAAEAHIGDASPFKPVSGLPLPNSSDTEKAR